MTFYVPGTLETDPKKVIMSLQQIGPGLDTANTNIATNTANIATNTANIATNTTNIATNTSNIAANTSAISAMQAAWMAYSPTITASSGTFTTVSGSGAYLAVGKTVVFEVVITITTVGTASGAVIVPLPVGTSNRKAVVTAILTNTGEMGSGSIAASGTSASVVKYNATTLIAAGNVIVISGVYEQT